MPDYSITTNFRPEIQNTRKLPRRSAYVEYYQEDDYGVGQFIALPGLNVRFSVTINMGNTYPQAQIDVCNLRRETREFLVNYFNMADPRFTKRVVRLYAGYLRNEAGAETDTPFLFAGNVLFTTLTPPPDIWLCMQTLYDKGGWDAAQEWKINGLVPIKDVYRIAAERMGYAAKIEDAPAGDILNFTASGDGKALLRRLRAISRKHAVYVADGQLIVKLVNANQPAPGEAVWECRADTGMIDIPKMNYRGADVTMLLNPDIHPGDWINLQSIHQPSASGLYRVWQVKHYGELRGDAFYSKLETYRPANSAS